MASKFRLLTKFYSKSIADKYDLKVIYDSSHAFGVKLNGKSIAEWGDISTFSFHATKVFNTFEGGLIISRDLETKKKIDALNNHGYINDSSYKEPGLIGINGKLNEFSAALGLLQMKTFTEVIERRKKVWHIYTNSLSNIKGINLPKIDGIDYYNYSYYPRGQ